MINWQLSKQGVRWPVSPDRIAGSGVDPSKSVFFEVIRWQFPRFQMIAGSRLLFFYDFDFILTSDAKIQPVFLKYRREDTLSRVGHAHHPIFMLWLVKIWQVSSCVNLCSILKVVYFDSWSWQSLESTCDVFNCLFPLDLQNEVQLLSRVFSYSWLVCLLGFWLRNASLPCWMRTRIINRTWTIDENRWSGNQSMTID